MLFTKFHYRNLFFERYLKTILTGQKPRFTEPKLKIM